MSALSEPDLWLGGRLKLHQPPRGAHRAGTDAVLLAGLLRADAGETLCDVGAGTGAVGLAAALAEPGCQVLLVERDMELADIARANVAANGLTERVAVLVADVVANASERRIAGLLPGTADLVLTNPPFFEAGRHRPSPNAQKAQAHTFAADGLDAWLRTCTGLLKSGGRLGLIHRADALPDCLIALRGRFGAVRARPVHPNVDRPAIRVLITAVKGIRSPFAIEPPLVLHDESGRFTAEAAALHGGIACGSVPER